MKMGKYYCPECEQELQDEEVVIRYSEADTETCWYCMNPECVNYDKMVYDSGDIDSMNESEAMENAMDLEREWRYENENKTNR
jgi:hypothetical protein